MPICYVLFLFNVPSVGLHCLRQWFLNLVNRPESFFKNGDSEDPRKAKSGSPVSGKRVALPWTRFWNQFKFFWSTLTPKLALLFSIRNDFISHQDAPSLSELFCYLDTLSSRRLPVPSGKINTILLWASYGLCSWENPYYITFHVVPLVHFLRRRLSLQLDSRLTPWDKS